LDKRKRFGWTLLLVSVFSGVSAVADEFPDRYWPVFPIPQRIVRSESFNRLGFDECMLLQTLSGLVAHDTRELGGGEMVWLANESPSYTEWLSRWTRRTGVPSPERAYTVWELVKRYREQGVVKGYILYEQEHGERPLYEGTASDTSANVATSLCPLLGGVAVEAGLVEKARANGLPMLLDVRGKDERWLWEHYGERLSRSVLGRQDPKNAVMRTSLVAMRTMTVSGTDELYEEVLRRMRPGSPVLGWGIGAEDAQTGPASRHGLFQTATNWCANLPLLSAGETGLAYPFRPFDSATEPDGDDNTRYVTFIISDGDNVQWLMLNFCEGREARQYWACPERGAMPMGWTIPAMDLLQLCPYTLDYLRETATRNDGFVLLGGGYYYPDWFGTARPDVGLLGKHARRTAKYMRKCGLRTLLVNTHDWDSDAAVKAYETYAREIPELDAVFVIQYYPYTGGNGAIRWVGGAGGREVPVVTCRNAIWGHRSDTPAAGTPGEVAVALNAWAAEPVRRPEDRFAWVIVHCWSWFRDAADPEPGAVEETEQEATERGEDEARGYRPALWCSRRLSPNIRVVTPTAFAARLQQVRAQEDDSW